MKMYDKFYSAQEILIAINPNSVIGSEVHGFNWRLQGYDEREFNGDRMAYNLADKMINSGQIFYVNNFRCKCGGFRFMYGASWACNTCNNHFLTPDWWHVKVEKDGNAFICKGNGFEDLQTSDNYAYGETKTEALENYRQLFINI